MIPPRNQKRPPAVFKIKFKGKDAYVQLGKKDFTISLGSDSNF